METIKSHTDISQSRKLAEFLSIESADMSYMSFDNHITLCPYIKMINDGFNKDEVIPCWSFIALFRLLPNSAQLEKGHATELYRITLPIEFIDSDWCINPVDACVAMIERLHELNLL